MIHPFKEDAGEHILIDLKKPTHPLILSMTKFSCRISNIGQTGEYDAANPGYNTALLDIYHIRCQRWQDPNQHAITKYIFKGKLTR